MPDGFPGGAPVPRLDECHERAVREMPGLSDGHRKVLLNLVREIRAEQGDGEAA